MITQNEYNQWAISMAEGHLMYPYETTNETYNNSEYVVFNIQHPTDPEKSIKVTTYGRELTLHFWKFHSHFDMFEDEDHEEAFRDLCEYIDDLMNDEIYFSASYKENDHLCSTMASCDLEDHIEDKYSKIEIKTWSGKYDQIINNG